MNKYVLNINKGSFIWRYGNKGLVYNTDNYESFIFENIGKIAWACDHLDVLENLYTLILDESYKENYAFVSWIDNMLAIDAASISIFKNDDDVTVSLKPVRKIHNNINTILSKKLYNDIVDCISEITIHLSGQSLISRREIYYKQFIYPIDMDEILDFDNLLEFMKYISPRENLTINLVGMIFNYPFIDQLIEFLEDRKYVVNIYITAECIFQDKMLIVKRLEKFAKFFVICDISDYLSLRIDPLISAIENKIYVLLLSCDLDVDLLDKIDPDDVFELKPVYTGDNESFLSKYIFMSQNDLDNIKLSKREIFANQTINTNFFGKLEILPDGSVFDNVNFDKIGFVDDDFWGLIKSVFDDSRAWFYYRKQYPCINCIYQCICPSPSNYELILNKPNLCSVIE